MLGDGLHRLGGIAVSIRARPHGRAMRWLAGLALPRKSCFNPHPASRSGDAKVHGLQIIRGKFQSAPGLTVGRCLSMNGQRIACGMFQSAPGLTVGRCDVGTDHGAYEHVEFQSAPGLTVGRCAVAVELDGLLAGFNPRPASRSGDAPTVKSTVPSLIVFQSAPGLTVGRCPPTRSPARPAAGFNPRPASRSGDACTRKGWASPCSGFNPRPASRSGDARTTTASTTG